MPIASALQELFRSALLRLLSGILIAVPLAFSAVLHPALIEPQAAATSAQTTVTNHSWSWPLRPPPAVLRGFDQPAAPWLAGHRGVDLAAPPRAQLYAPSQGVISFVGWVVDRKVLTIDHGLGLKSSFEAIESALSTGTAVKQGQAVARLAASNHCGPASCLHWGVRRNAVYLNPLLFLSDRRPSVLLPISGRALNDYPNQAQVQPQEHGVHRSAEGLLPNSHRPDAEALGSWMQLIHEPIGLKQQGLARSPRGAPP
ncbi:M23 family metallopeptidase [Psychromicrobium sp. YIM B11713]|uniref:M23 family metallopeptidase n=1 Tax=Psychromicrobium sp. YIM B11713 TaxID=3145233 RepID=UPI00374EFB09